MIVTKAKSQARVVRPRSSMRRFMVSPPRISRQDGPRSRRARCLTHNANFATAFSFHSIPRLGTRNALPPAPRLQADGPHERRDGDPALREVHPQPDPPGWLGPRPGDARTGPVVPFPGPRRADALLGVKAGRNQQHRWDLVGRKMGRKATRVTATSP